MVCHIVPKELATMIPEKLADLKGVQLETGRIDEGKREAIPTDLRDVIELLFKSAMKASNIKGSFF
jgi:hypothetical protein